MAEPHSDLPGSLRAHTRASAAIRTPNGMFFGSLLWVEPRRILVQVDAEVAPGMVADVKVDLSPHPGTVLAKGKCVRQVPVTAMESARYIFKIVEISEDDQRVWNAWIKALRGGSAQDLQAAAKKSSSSDADSGVRAHEIRHVLDRMAGGKGVSTAPSQPSFPRSDATHSDAHALRSDVREAGAARAAMRAALRRALASAPTPEQDEDEASVPPRTPSPSPAPAAPRSVTPAGPPAPPIPARSAASTPSVAPARPPPPAAPVRDVPTAARPPSRPTEPAAADDPTYSVSMAKGQAWLAVRWRSTAALGYDLHSQLSRGVLSLAATGEPLPTGDRLSILLQFESLYVQAPATLVDGGPFGAVYKIEIAAPDLAALEAAVRPRSDASDVRQRFRGD